MPTRMTLQEIFRKKTKESLFLLDAAQDQLIEELATYKVIIEQKHSSKKTLLQKIGFKQSKPTSPHNGIYIWGGVGRGKSMLLDLFYESLEIKQKIRIHFHEFMLNFHKQLNALQQSNAGLNRQEDYIKQIANQIAKKYQLICLDEIQVNNIADAMIVGRVFEQLLKNDVFIFFTSNRKPTDLFKDGLQRERFEPFINLILNKLMTFNLDNFTDYRLMKIATLKQSYLSPLNKNNEQLLENILTDLKGDKQFNGVSIFIDLNHSLIVHNAFNKVAQFTFNELCEIPFGAIDYIALCRNFNTIIIKNIPQLDADNHNEALRFITLVDCMYEHNTRLICTAAALPEKLYKNGRNQFEFARTVSRLLEMQSVKYINKMEQEQAA